MKTQSAIKKTFWTTFAFYALIGFEFLYMASPFAVYFYSVYQPGLELLDNYPSVSWITAFFLPHLVEDTKSVWINMLRPAGAVMAGTGLLIFFICAGQVYYSKIFKKGIVLGGLYKYIRHPQYSAFMLCSFGLLILWPRYLVLIMFITLMFVYYYLAITEENECEVKFGEAYKKYKDSTGMFLPVKIPYLKIFPNFKPGIKGKTILVSALYLFILFSSIQFADFLKKHSINSLYTIDTGKGLFLSVFKKNPNEIKQVIDLINSNELAGSISGKSRSNKFINYILPTDMYISEIPMVKLENAGNHIVKSEYTSDKIKVILTEAMIKNKKNVKGADILYNVISLKPEAEIWIDLNTKSIIKSFRLNSSNIRYKNIPEPVF
ncbi:MAG: isoprenylcysteine carboxylmethyltransferase family protein [Ignavibacteriaceae bacterium]